MSGRRGRGRLNAFDQLPEECDALIAEACQMLIDRSKTQLEIYTWFYDECQRLMRDSHGELSFQVPSKSAFNRFSIRRETMSRRLAETQQIAGAIAKRFDAEASDELTLIAAEAIKTLVFEVLTAAGEHGIDPKGAKNLADALRSAVSAQNVSTSRRQKVEAEFARDVDEAVEKVARVKGLTADTVNAIKAQILGVAE